jgi:pimeloyl-ACP methyl ester carboxylesterase
LEFLIDRRKVVFEDTGPEEAARPLVLLHPFPFDHRFWDDFVVRLGGAARVLAPDLRGFGGSELGLGFSLADLADDVAALLDHRGVDRAIPVGVSMGGYVALAFAARHAARLAGLVLVDTKSGPDAPETRAARGEAIKLVERDGVAAFVERQLPKLVGPAAGDGVRESVRRLAAQPAAAVVSALKALRDRPDRRSELGAIACPALVVVGGDDAITPPAEARLMADGIPRARLVEIAGAGHLPPLETPDAFADAIRGFLASLVRSSNPSAREA